MRKPPAASVVVAQAKLTECGRMTKDLEEMRRNVWRLVSCNKKIASTIAMRKATLLKEDSNGGKREWLVMGGPNGGAEPKDPPPVCQGPGWYNDWHPVASRTDSNAKMIKSRHKVLLYHKKNAKRMLIFRNKKVFGLSQPN